MRSSPESVRLTFVLPKGARLLPCGVHRDWVKGCELTVAMQFIAIRGPSRERVQEQAARVIRACCQDLENVAIGAVMETTGPGAGRDGWTVIVNADIAFAPTALGASFPAAEEQAHGAPSAVA